MRRFVDLVIVIGASLSEPHINMLNASHVCMYVCMYPFVRPTINISYNYVE